MKVGEAVGHRPETFSYERDSETWAAPGLRIGLEIEVENPNNAELPAERIAPFWEFQQDGSLRDHGFEIILTAPLFGKDLTNSIRAAEAALNNAPFVFNYRTGLHVHVDSRNLELKELERLLVIYGLFEEALFNFVGDNRNNNNFCAPWGRVSDHLENVFAIFDEENEVEEIRNNIGQVERYSALNCNALNKFGSLEFRHMQMTHDFDKIRKWINLIMCVYNASLSGAPYGADLQRDIFIKEVSKGGADGVAKSIFPEWFLAYITDTAMWNGILLIQDITSNIKMRNKFGESSILSICPIEGINPGLEIFKQKNLQKGAA